MARRASAPAPAAVAWRFGADVAARLRGLAPWREEAGCARTEERRHVDRRRQSANAERSVDDRARDDRRRGQHRLGRERRSPLPGPAQRRRRAIRHRRQRLDDLRSDRHREAGRPDPGRARRARSATRLPPRPRNDPGSATRAVSGRMRPRRKLVGTVDEPLRGKVEEPVEIAVAAVRKALARACSARATLPRSRAPSPAGRARPGSSAGFPCGRAARRWARPTWRWPGRDGFP